ncbi:MAG: UDP-galactopyranose mutase [Chthoniobacter sp.]|jgi:UDP-galactopyranose mutase|nr:UDP-galactopyranose mutase [Chthoniobacter sp.]
MSLPRRFLVVGAGFSGAVMARQLAENCACHVTVMEERSHVAGNCHTERDESTGVMVHRYGPHIFNTNRRDVWDFVNTFAEFGAYINRVKAINRHGVFPLPVNLQTINQFFGKTMGPKEAEKFVEDLGDKTIGEPRNFEEQALKFVGRQLYEAFFYGYSKKQWGCEPSALPASILKRLPVRFNYDDNYYDATYQGIPLQGYTAIVEAILDHKSLDIILNAPFSPADTANFDHVFYTGPIDAFFEYRHGRLGYRTVTFDRGVSTGDYQGNAVINYGELDVPFTRVHEHKHFAPWEQHEKTVYFREFSKETEPGDTPYYPKRLKHDKELLAIYRKAAKTMEKTSFLGRLGTYRYLNMDQVIGETLDFAKVAQQAIFSNTKVPVFSNQEPA